VPVGDDRSVNTKRPDDARHIIATSMEARIDHHAPDHIGAHVKPGRAACEAAHTQALNVVVVFDTKRHEADYPLPECERGDNFSM